MDIKLYKTLREPYDAKLAEFKKKFNVTYDDGKISSDSYSLTDLVNLMKDMKAEGENSAKVANHKNKEDIESILKEKSENIKDIITYLNKLGVGFNPTKQEIYPLDSQKWQMPELNAVTKAALQIFLYGLKVGCDTYKKPMLKANLEDRPW
jgi:hypothetical protein